MSNEAIFIIQILVGLVFTLLAFRFGFHWLIALIAVQAVLMNIFVLKLMNVFTLEITGGNVLYASIFLGTDMICEHYGKDKARQAIWIGFGASIFFVVMSQFIMMYSPSIFDTLNFSDALFKIFANSPRIVFASMGAYLISQHLDIYIFNKIKTLTKGKFLWLRNNGSTIVSQLVDTLFFTFAGLYGTIATADNVWDIILFTYIVKLVIALFDTPFIYLSKSRLFKPAKKENTI